MANDVTLACDQIKTIVANQPGTPTQKLLAILAACGVENTAELAAMIGIGDRAIQLAKRASPKPVSAKCTSAKCTSAKCTSETKPASPETNLASVARVEETYFPSLQEDRPESEVKCSEVLLRADAPKPKREARGTRLDREWSLPDSWRTWSRTNFPQTTAERVTAEADTFRDHWIAQPGQRGRKADWEATWRNWCRKAFATAPLRPHSQPPPRPADDRIARGRALMAKLNLHEVSP